MIDREAVEKLRARGKRRGYLTFDEVDEAFPADIVSSEEIEGVLRNLGGLGIELIEEPTSLAPPGVPAA